LYNLIQEQLPGTKLAGYDINCSFKKTIEGSSVGKTGKTRGLSYVVPAMHGYAHNRPCQLTHHPLYFNGAGLEDFETCERFFSRSNACASTTRHASSFHRHQQYDLFFRHSDHESWANIGLMLRNNYSQAATIIKEYPQMIKDATTGRNIESDEFDEWLKEEAAFLLALEKEPEENSLAIVYVESLQKLNDAEYDD
jgi:hypothetical protein